MNNMDNNTFIENSNHDARVKADLKLGMLRTQELDCFPAIKEFIIALFHDRLQRYTAQCAEAGVPCDPRHIKQLREQTGTDLGIPHEQVKSLTGVPKRQATLANKRKSKNFVSEEELTPKLNLPFSDEELINIICLLKKGKQDEANGVEMAYRKTLLDIAHVYGPKLYNRLLPLLDIIEGIINTYALPDEAAQLALTPDIPQRNILNMHEEEKQLILSWLYESTKNAPVEHHIFDYKQIDDNKDLISKTTGIAKKTITSIRNQFEEVLNKKRGKNKKERQQEMRDSLDNLTNSNISYNELVHIITIVDQLPALPEQEQLATMKETLHILSHTTIRPVYFDTIKRVRHLITDVIPAFLDKTASSTAVSQNTEATTETKEETINTTPTLVPAPQPDTTPTEDTPTETPLILERYIHVDQTVFSTSLTESQGEHGDTMGKISVYEVRPSTQGEMQQATPTVARKNISPTGGSMGKISFGFSS